MLISLCGYNFISQRLIKFACQRARALSRVAITIFVGMDGFGINMIMKVLLNLLLLFILT
jgi:hypothetical protein